MRLRRGFAVLVVVSVLSSAVAAADCPGGRYAKCVDVQASADGLDRLLAHLEQSPKTRRPGDLEAIAHVPLTLDDAEEAKDALWQDLVAVLRVERAAEHAAQAITYGGYTLRYETVELGEPEEGRDLFISMHGGGGAPAEVNDEQWYNQIDLGEAYAPAEAIWVAPRAPTDEWNMWFREEIDVLFDRLVTNFVVLEGIDPDRVYLFGYSAGGDGVYGLAPRSADRWAGAASSAGHPNGVSFANLRNLAFAIHVGGDDGAFQRTDVARQSIEQFAALRAGDPEGYPFQGHVHPGLPHWMDLADAEAIPFLQAHTRNPVPSRVVWEQLQPPQQRSYWLGVEGDDVRPGTRIVASLDGQQITLEEANGISSLVLWLDDRMLDLDQEVRVVYQGQTLFEGRVTRTLDALRASLALRSDPSLVFSARLEVDLSH